ncbi:phosphatidylinositol 3 [Drepanopeziza brunnea f. sp. 'multigermtubi' MB_m1]|uniref:1-phosphatidylinositol 4-kinase n=1 Tax=Marssonina brunnea f. sp. multigermtubi (strain MB_m1) TaxID=1072389 RepID=K1Y7X2_MARBU|nr:phosphatidylinositol 3 [Drepanopeziza brunnea f. sp. 'multigermtubi' MB_m1]EKD21199.1 phosphatidylinositol 3 [Drepanopeziza brunnea f. sp. 'multigermtubi' MB_m1]
MSWDLLKRFIESDVFNQNPFLSVAYLSRYEDHVGIHYVLCSKLRQFSYEEIEFFLPQLCHLIISVDNESMALEEFILDLCEESVNAALLTFWLFQTYLHDLSTNPQSEAFKTCRRISNKVQNIVFGGVEPGRNEKIKENVLPVTVLASFVLASVAVPFLPKWAGPLAIAQARRPQSTGNVISDAIQTQQKLVRSNTTTPGSTRSRRLKDASRGSKTPVNGTFHTDARPKPSRTSSGTNLSSTFPPDSRLRGDRSYSHSPISNDFHADAELKTSRSPSLERASSSNSSMLQPIDPRPRPPHLELQTTDPRLSSTSLPLPEVYDSQRMSPIRPATPATAGLAHRSTEHVYKKHVARPLTPGALSEAQKIKLLRQNYFRCQTQFLTALEDISTRLILVPKAARLSALRAELALIAQDLPAEVDIPVICPASLVDGIPSKSRHHRIVRLNPAEATVLNSAEKVPYLLMVEVLRDDFSFDPSEADNERLLGRLLSEQGSGRRRIFDLSESAHTPNGTKNTEVATDSVFEPVSGDLGSPSLVRATDVLQEKESMSSSGPPRLSSGATTLSTASGLATPRSSGASTSGSSSPSRKMTIPLPGRSGAADQPDFSALATHMRMASQMLAQLDSTSGKRPKHEVAAIRAKIIASMQSLEEQSFEPDDGTHPPTFDTIMANATATSTNVVPEDIDEGTTTDVPLNTEAGAARMENDQKTGGVQRKGDRDDPSAATFGEAWNVKKERIRKSSPYGWMKNWDVLSVIVKTGDDLRQEAFACQLIQVCDKIWQDAQTPVWVKRMRILVTGESSGLIETITNGVSLHSLKRSLTLATIESGQNPRRRIATLKDHFVKTFGPPESEAYQTAQSCFKRSLAAYSIISYILQLKDRHNGNVLVDNEGHIIHIDFGFMLSNSPGSVGLEAAPFKLTQDYVDVLGGVGSPAFDDYKKLCKRAFQALRRSADNIIELVNMMGRASKMPCFSYGVLQATNSLRQRFQLQLSADEAEQFVETDLIGKSLGSYYTRLYDTFQYRTQGIY